MDRKNFLSTLFVFALAGLGLAACGGDDPEPEPQSTPAPVVEEREAPTLTVTPEPERGDIEIEATDLLGAFEGEVFGLAVSRNADAVFESTVLAANGDAGLALVPIDLDADPTMVLVDEGAITAVAVGGLSGTPLIALERETDSGSALWLGTFDERRRGVVAVPTDALPFAAAARDLCFGDGTLYRVGADGGVTALDLLPGADGGISVERRTVDSPAVTDCAPTPAAVYGLGSDGAVVRFEGGRSVSSGSLPAATERLAVMPHPGGAPTMFAILPDGRVRSGTDVFRFSIGNAAVDVTDLAFGAGNYGTIYRNGVGVILTADNGLALVSWLAVANALGLETETVTRADTGERGIGPAAPIDIDIIDPSGD